MSILDEDQCFIMTIHMLRLSRSFQLHRPDNYGLNLKTHTVSQSLASRSREKPCCRSSPSLSVACTPFKSRRSWTEAKLDPHRLCLNGGSLFLTYDTYSHSEDCFLGKERIYCSNNSSTGAALQPELVPLAREDDSRRAGKAFRS